MNFGSSTEQGGLTGKASVSGAEEVTLNFRVLICFPFLGAPLFRFLFGLYFKVECQSVISDFN